MSGEGEEVPKHHVRHDICATRKRYRDGRRDTAVKVYTVSQESRYVMVVGVPAVGASQELVKLCALYGQVDEYRIMDEYPGQEDHTEVYWIKFNKIQAARVAKKKLDDYSFFGGVLHVFYCPEYETVADTRAKLIIRRRWVARQIRLQAEEAQRKPTDDEPTSFIDVIETPPTNRKTNQKPRKDYVATPITNSANQTPSYTTVPPLNYTNNQSTNQTISNNLASRPSTNQRTADRHVTSLTNHMYPEPTNQWTVSGHVIPPPPSSVRPDLMSYPSNQYMGSPLYSPETEKTDFRQSKHGTRWNNDPNNSRSSKHEQRTISNFKSRICTNTKPNSGKNSQSLTSKFDESDIKDANTSRKKEEITEEKDKNMKVVHGIKIKPYNAKSIPKFVPRQVKGNVSKPESLGGGSAERKKDDLDDVIRRNAYVLGPVTGPGQRPGTVKRDVTEEEKSLEKTRTAIREKLKTVCPALLPRQLRKRKRQEPEVEISSGEVT